MLKTRTLTQDSQLRHVLSGEVVTFVQALTHRDTVNGGYFTTILVRDVNGNVRECSPEPFITA